MSDTQTPAPLSGTQAAGEEAAKSELSYADLKAQSKSLAESLGIEAPAGNSSKEVLTAFISANSAEDAKAAEPVASAVEPIAPAAAPAPVADTAAAKAAVESMIDRNGIIEPEQLMSADAKRQKAYFETQPKMSFMIPFDIGESEGAYETVNINSYRLMIKKGVIVELPLDVVRILQEYLQISPENTEAGKRFIATRDEKTADALS